MALDTLFDAAIPESGLVKYESSIDSPLLIDQKGDKPWTKQIGINSTIEPANYLISSDRELMIKKQLGKIELSGFPVGHPWLPQRALKILSKLEEGQIAEKELLLLMDLVADRATDHFQLEEGKFVALTFLGRVVEVSDTRVGLLKKIQGRKFSERIFVWRVGFNSFSGRT
jgi:hypothetical protein